VRRSVSMKARDTARTITRATWAAMRGQGKTRTATRQATTRRP
jgi:hypothetical protein